LQTLHLEANQITTLPPEIGSLTTLQMLYLEGNQLTTLPPEIGSLAALQTLQLQGNQLTTLPPEINELSQLIILYLHDNASLKLPAETLGPRNNHRLKWREVPKPPRDILDYYFATLAGSRAMREVKLILVGRGEVGKTTLAEALQGNPFKDNRARTDGINISRWSIKPKGGETVVRIWDFGGQQIMHGTHQFFLTRRAIYVVMVDGRDDRAQREAEYWLKLVRAFGGDSTVIVVMNRQEAYKFDLDRNTLAMKYNVPPELFFRTECSDESTIRPVRDAILQLVGALLSTQANFPEKWWPIKTELEEMKQDYLSESEYRERCAANDIKEVKEQDQLLDRLNDLGTIVHFPDDNLADLKVLDPEWATDGVYRVVTNERLREEKVGTLRASTLREILPGDRWPQDLHRRYIIDLMLRFDLCFPAESENNVFIVPDLLTEKTPDLTAWDPAQCVVFQYKYPVLPHGILPRFISKTHTYSEGRERWRTGVVVAVEGAEALVRADYDDNTVEIWVRGEHRDARRELLTIIRGKFHEIHSRFEELNAEERVGVPKHPKVLVSYRDMILDERTGKLETRVTIEDKRVDVRIRDILSGIESGDQRKKAAKLEAARMGERELSLVLHGDYIAGDKKMGDDNRVQIRGSVYNSQVGQTLSNCTNMVNQQAPGRKKEVLEALRRDVEELIKRLPAGKVEEAPQVAENLEMVIKQATKEKPDRKWYSVSSEGLLDAAGWVEDFSGKIRGTIKNLGGMIWPDFSLPEA